MTEGGDQRPHANDGCQCKIGRNARKYDINGIDQDLQRRHAADASLRDLEQVVNVAILEHAMNDAGVPIIGSVESVFEALTDDDVSAGERTEVQGRLTAAGLELRTLESDFVSYQTIRTHLRECLGIETGDQREFTTGDAIGTIEWSRSRNEAVIERTLDRLRRRGTLEMDEFEVTSSIRVTCTNCGRSYPVDALVTGGRCECGGETTGKANTGRDR